MKLFRMLSGYKTYITAVMIVIAGVQMMAGGDWSGGFWHIVTSEKVFEGILTALAGAGLGSLRAAVQKLQVQLKQYHEYLSLTRPPVDGVSSETEAAKRVVL